MTIFITMKKVITTSEKETFDLGKKIAKNFCGGEIIGLVGDLGAGKTIFTKGIAVGLKLKENINSPTFVVMKIYDVKHKNIKKFVHIDAYRLKSAEELKTIGIDEYLNRDDVVIVIEWADKIKKILPDKARFINISIENQQRIINLKA